MTGVIALLAAGIGAIDSGALLWLAPVGGATGPAISMAVITSQIAPVDAGAALAYSRRGVVAPVLRRPGAMPKGWRSRGLAWHPQRPWRLIQP